MILGSDLGKEISFLLFSSSDDEDESEIRDTTIFFFFFFFLLRNILKRGYLTVLIKMIRRIKVS